MADSSATFTAVDLSRLPAPHVLQALSYEAIYTEILAAFQAMAPDFDATVESDPAVKLLQLFAYYVQLTRQRVNEAARAVMPAYAIGSDLDHLAALLGIARQMLDPGNADLGIPATMESDPDFRRRMVLAPEGYSVAGPEGAYISHALGADPDVLDASATSPMPGHVVITVLSRAGDGTAAPELLAAVAARTSDENVRPLTDYVTVQSATIIAYQIVAQLRTFAGPDGSVVIAEARRRLDAYVEECHRLGRDVTRSGIFAALHSEGVQNVSLIAPADDLVLDRTQASWCTGITVDHVGIGE